MKKVLIFLATGVFMVALFFTSCKKDWTCECTTTAGGVSSTSSVTIHSTKKDAKDACEQKATVSVPGATSSVSCKIK